MPRRSMRSDISSTAAPAVPSRPPDVAPGPAGRYLLSVWVLPAGAMHGRSAARRSLHRKESRHGEHVARHHRRAVRGAAAGFPQGAVPDAGGAPVAARPAAGADRRQRGGDRARHRRRLFRPCLAGDAARGAVRRARRHPPCEVAPEALDAHPERADGPAFPAGLQPADAAAARRRRHRLAVELPVPGSRSPRRSPRLPPATG